jgi:hypothetical protein
MTFIKNLKKKNYTSHQYKLLAQHESLLDDAEWRVIN